MTTLYLYLHQLDECEATACAAPAFPADSRLKLEQAGALTFAFGQNASFACDGDDVHFEGDRNMERFSVTCMNSGRWNLPSEWPKCIEGEFLFTVFKELAIIATFNFKMLSAQSRHQRQRQGPGSGAGNSPISQRPSTIL